jgi:hypothetical protein
MDNDLSYDDITLIADAMDFRKILTVYDRIGFEAACDELAAQFDKAREELPEPDDTEHWLDNVNRARDMNAER